MYNITVIRTHETHEEQNDIGLAHMTLNNDWAVEYQDIISVVYCFIVLFSHNLML